jgi:hypothetical protein
MVQQCHIRTLYVEILFVEVQYWKGASYLADRSEALEWWLAGVNGRNSEMLDLKLLQEEDVDSINLAQDRTQWRSLVKITFGFHKRCGISSVAVWLLASQKKKTHKVVSVSFVQSLFLNILPFCWEKVTWLENSNMAARWDWCFKSQVVKRIIEPSPKSGDFNFLSFVN